MPFSQVGDITRKGTIIDIIFNAAKGRREYKIECNKCKKNYIGSIQSATKKGCHNCYNIKIKENAKYKIGTIVNTNRILGISRKKVNNSKRSIYEIECIKCKNIKTIQNSNDLDRGCTKCYIKERDEKRTKKEYKSFIVISTSYIPKAKKRYCTVICSDCNHIRVGQISTLTKTKCKVCNRKKKGLPIIGEPNNNYTIIDRITNYCIVVHKNCNTIFSTLKSGSINNPFNCNKCYPPKIKVKRILGIEKEYNLIMNELETREEP